MPVTQHRTGEISFELLTLRTTTNAHSHFPSLYLQDPDTESIGSKFSGRVTRVNAKLATGEESGTKVNAAASANTSPTTLCTPAFVGEPIKRRGRPRKQVRAVHSPSTDDDEEPLATKSEKAKATEKSREDREYCFESVA